MCDLEEARRAEGEGDGELWLAERRLLRVLGEALHLVRVRVRVG